jgi:ATP synthase protein I
MSNQTGNSSGQESQDNLKNLSDRLDAAKQKHSKETDAPDNSVLGMAWRISTELVVAVVIGTAIGFTIDHFTGTKPWITIAGLTLGTIAGIRNTFRLVQEMEKVEQERLRQQTDSLQ